MRSDPEFNIKTKRGFDSLQEDVKMIIEGIKHEAQSKKQQKVKTKRGDTGKNYKY